MWFIVLLFLPAVFAAQCKDPNAELIGEQWVCKDKFTDVTETRAPESYSYKKGEWCISDEPCHHVKDLSINFLVDSSSSINDNDNSSWKRVINIVGDAGGILPPWTKASIIKFSTNVTFAGTVPAGWNEKSFKKFVPKHYDNGVTNTAEALEKANEMFKDDSSKNKVAVLVTDGLPFVHPYEFYELFPMVKKAAEELRSNNVSLVIFGYGDLYSAGTRNRIKSDIDYLKELLENPEKDYCGYDKIVQFMQPIHMANLLEKVCARFKS